MDDAHAHREAAPASPVDAPAAGVPRHPRAYLWQLLGLLIPATIFEGYDITIFHLCTPDIAATFHLGNQAIGVIASIVRFGTVLSFLVISCSDRVGRKPVISVTVLGYGLFTLFTGLSRGLVSFTLFQSLSQVFLASEFGYGDHHNQRGIPGRIARPGDRRLSHGGVRRSRRGGLAVWLRGGVAVGMARDVSARDSPDSAGRVSQAIRARDRAFPRASRLADRPSKLAGDFRAQVRMFRGPYRGRLTLVAVLANSVGFVGGPTITYFSLFAKRDHHWTSTQVGSAVIVAYLMATVGTVLCGYLLDSVGRRLTTSAFYLGAGISMVVLFQSTRHHAILLGFMATMFAYQGARTATAALSAELFPTAIRAAGYSSTIQTLGQLAWFVSPMLVGTMSLVVGGLGNAASLCAIGPVVGAVLILLYAPETRGKTLEEMAL